MTALGNGLGGRCLKPLTHGRTNSIRIAVHHDTACIYGLDGGHVCNWTRSTRVDRGSPSARKDHKSGDRHAHE